MHSRFLLLGDYLRQLIDLRLEVISLLLLHAVLNPQMLMLLMDKLAVLNELILDTASHGGVSVDARSAH